MAYIPSPSRRPKNNPRIVRVCKYCGTVANEDPAKNYVLRCQKCGAGEWRKKALDE